MHRNSILQNDLHPLAVEMIAPETPAARLPASMIAANPFGKVSRDLGCKSMGTHSRDMGGWSSTARAANDARWIDSAWRIAA